MYSSNGKCNYCEKPYIMGSEKCEKKDDYPDNAVAGNSQGEYQTKKGYVQFWTEGAKVATIKSAEEAKAPANCQSMRDDKCVSCSLTYFKVNGKCVDTKVKFTGKIIDLINSSKIITSLLGVFALFGLLL